MTTTPTTKRTRDITSGVLAGILGAIAVLAGAELIDPALLEVICGPSVVPVEEPVEAPPEKPVEAEPVGPVVEPPS